MELFSIKARSSRKDIHISGAERIVNSKELEKTVLNILKKVNRENADFISIKIKRLNRKPILLKKSLCIKELKFNDFKDANNFAINYLSEITGIKKERLSYLINLIHSGASPNGENMRGAIIVNQRGERLELDKYRGVRTTTVDFINREDISKKLLDLGFTERTLDALALSTKNLYNQNILAEYCVSDDMDYITGYVATKEEYIRIFPLKEKGNRKGGRIYFVKNDTDINELYNYLENYPILIEDVCLKEILNGIMNNKDNL